MSTTPTIQSTWRCFSPTAGIFSGVLLGWLIHFFLPEPSSFAVDLAARTLDLIVALTGWAIGTAAYGRKVHCGGSEKANAMTRERYSLIAVWLLVPFVLAPIFLVAGQIYWYYLDALFLLAVLCGEIKLGKPFWFLSNERIL